MVLSTLLGFIYPPPASIYLTAMTFISGASLANAGISEVKGKNMQYSKFWNINKNNVEASKSEMIKVSGRNGMLLLYSPAFVAGITSLAFFQEEGLRFTLLTSALAIHFFKRVFEVLFIHKYSGSMPIDAVIVISTSYFVSTITMIYSQYLAGGFSDPIIDLKYAGIALFSAGIVGNFYHHYLLSKLRKDGDKEYKIPQGGLFDLVTCPHYLFEILGFIGISCISQTLYAFSYTVGTIGYLMGRSYATRRWYISKFEDFPKDTKALIPFIF